MPWEPGWRTAISTWPPTCSRCRTTAPKDARRNEFFARVHPKAALVPAPKSLWLSDRSKQIRDYFAEQKIPTYVSGIDGNVTVVMTTQGFTIRTEHAAP